MSSVNLGPMFHDSQFTPCMLRGNAQQNFDHQSKAFPRESKLNHRSDKSNKMQSCGRKIPIVVLEKSKNSEIMHPEKLGRLRKNVCIFL